MPLPPPPPGPALDLVAGRATELGGVPIARLLPRRPRRTVGGWCFLDAMGPTAPDVALEVGPHPHIGLQTVTWLLEGEVVHRDSLGVEQPIRPGQLNLMTAGRGVAHAEEGATGRPVRGAQLWVAQPEATRHGDAAFEHHEELPEVDLGGGVRAAVLVGELAGARSPARHDTALLGAELRGGGRCTIGLAPGFEHAVAVLEGTATVAGRRVGADELLHLGDGRDEVEVALGAGAVALLLGGEPLGEELVMWWNFVARTGTEVDDARTAWEAGDDRFGTVASHLPRVPAPAR